MPVAESKGETRNLSDVMFDLADRVGVRAQYNEQLDEFYTFRKARQAGKTYKSPSPCTGGQVIKHRVHG